MGHLKYDAAVEVQGATACANPELRGAAGPEIQTFVRAGVGDCPGREERSWLRQKLAPATLSSLAGKGEPAKEPMRQPESQQNVMTWKPAGEGLEEEAGGGVLCQMSHEGDWGDGVGKLQD